MIFPKTLKDKYLFPNNDKFSLQGSDAVGKTANGFFRSGQIEAWGRGIEKMRNGCIADGLPEPEFTILPDMFSICFRIRNNNAAAKNANTENNFGINFGINETQKKIVELMAANPEITAGQIAEAVNVTKRQVESNISKLKSMRIIERVGARKSGKWIVKQF